MEGACDNGAPMGSREGACITLELEPTVGLCHWQAEVIIFAQQERCFLMVDYQHGLNNCRRMTQACLSHSLGQRSPTLTLACACAWLKWRSGAGGLWRPTTLTASVWPCPPHGDRAAMEWPCIELWPDPLGCDDGCMLLWELTLHADSMVRCHENVSRELEALCSPMQSGYMTDGPATTLLEKMCHQDRKSVV